MSNCVVWMDRVPKNCDDGCWGSLSGECPWCDSIDGYKMVGNRPPNCPIIAVLPENHGNLIDLETAAEGLSERYNSCHMTCGAVMQFLDGLPTIVPAERREKDGTD